MALARGLSDGLVPPKTHIILPLLLLLLLLLLLPLLLLYLPPGCSLASFRLGSRSGRSGDPLGRRSRGGGGGGGGGSSSR
eukprot:7042221-Heterocapsa_arctica.AAC.1